jgi:aldose 1-epimerase
MGSRRGRLDGAERIATMTDTDVPATAPAEPKVIGAGGPLQATFLPSLGMVCSSLLHQGDELLDLRGGPAEYAEHGSTFGIPLLHPWANRLSDWRYDAGGGHVELDRRWSVVQRDSVSGLPIHGLLAASRDWTVTDAQEQSLTAVLDFGAHHDLLLAFPFPHSLEFHAAIDAARLSIRLTVTPTSPKRVPISFGFHPYLRLPGSDRRTWELELPVRRRATLDSRGIPNGTSQSVEPDRLSGPLADRVFDDCFDQLVPAPTIFAVSDERRRIGVEFVSGYTVAQVYAPAASQFICFEPMTAPVDALKHGRGLRWADPGGNFFAEFAVSVEDRG